MPGQAEEATTEAEAEDIVLLAVEAAPVTHSVSFISTPKAIKRVMLTCPSA